MKIRFYGEGCLPDEILERNRLLSAGYPPLGDASCERLAVIGGGHSITDHIEELRAFDGERWISASAFKWCAEHGIDGWFYNAHPRPLVKPLAVGVKKALLWDSTDPSVFQTIQGADVRVFPLKHGATDIDHGITTVTCAPTMAVRAGFKDITFFGCDSSWPAGASTHTYEDNAGIGYRIRVRCGGEDFDTSPHYLAQAEYLATVIRSIPKVFKERSGGLLRAMVKDPEYDITHGTMDLHRDLVAA